MKKAKLKNGNWACQSCKQELCNKCQISAHPDKQCPKVDESSFRAWAASSEGVKNCPKCGARTQKADGCNHMTCHRCRNNWCWICGQSINELHYEQTRIFTGCPGLQFVGAQPWKLALMLIGAFLLNPIVFAVVPVGFGFGYSFYIAGLVADWVMRRLNIYRSCCICCLVAPWLYLLLLAVALPICTAGGAIASALLVCIGSPLLMLYIIFFGLKLLILNCRTF